MRCQTISGNPPSPYWYQFILLGGGGVKKGTVGIKCLAQEHNTMIQTGLKLRVLGFNHPASAFTLQNVIFYFLTVKLQQLMNWTAICTRLWVTMP